MIQICYLTFLEVGIWHRSHWVAFFTRTPWETLLSFIFPLLDGCLVHWAMTLLSSKPTLIRWVFLRTPSLCVWLFCLSLPSVKSFATTGQYRHSLDLKVSPCDTTYSLILEIRMLASLGGEFFFLPYLLKYHFTKST